MYDLAKIEQTITQAIAEVCPDHTVRHGPFQGMKYAETKSVGSALFPKLLGCYEREIHPVIERICDRPYSEIIDIGCAEGYYAVGLAMRIPTATVHAFDTHAEGIRLCQSMAEQNGVAERLVTGEFCDRATLNAFSFRGRGLIFCDCEGYEQELLTEVVRATLSKHDLLIEIHDGLDPSISANIRQLFSATHRLEAIKVVDDATRLATYHYPELERYDQETRGILTAECRAISTEWFFLESLA